MSQIRMQNHLAGMRADVSYQMDPSLQQEIKHVSLDLPSYVIILLICSESNPETLELLSLLNIYRYFRRNKLVT